MNSESQKLVDVAVSTYGRPYQLALSVLSLLKYCGRHIDKVFFQFEPVSTQYDPGLPYAAAQYIRERAVVFQPESWLYNDPVEPDRLSDRQYLLGVRYQHAWENTDKKRLLVIHSDIMVFMDFLGPMLENMGEAFAIGPLGQCWNCPASLPELVAEAGLGERPCSPDSYLEFRPDFAGLGLLYAAAVRRGAFARPYPAAWEGRFKNAPWPLPECRVNEWAALVNVAKTRPLTMPLGDSLPYGAYERCGKAPLDISVAWFHTMHQHGLTAKNFNIDRYMKHWIGTGNMTPMRYAKAEDNARRLLERHFPDFAAWCRESDTGLFA